MTVVSTVFVETSMVDIKRSIESVLIGFTTVEGGAVLDGLSKIGGSVVTKVVALMLADEVITRVLVVVGANTLVGLIILTVAVSIRVSVVVGAAVVISISSSLTSVVINISEVVVGTAFIGVMAVRSRASVVIGDSGIIVVTDVVDCRVPETIIL